MKKFTTFLLIFLTMLQISAVGADSVELFWDHEPIKAAKGEDLRLSVAIKMPPDLFLYAEKTDLEFVAIDLLDIKAVEYPRPSKKRNPLNGKIVEIYKNGTEIIVDVQVPSDAEDGIYELEAVLHYQGCTEKICLRPVEKDIMWQLYVGNVAMPSSGFNFSAIFDSFMNLVRGKSSASILSISFGWLLLIAFLGGILSSFTPCILPLIPITLLIIGVDPKRNWKSNFGLALLLVIGMSITYALLGLIAGFLGLSFGFIFQSRIFIVILILFFTLMALSLLGIYTFQLPQGVRNGLARIGGGGPRGAFFAGASMGLLATPCVGPVLAALLVYAASTQSLGKSFVLLMVYSIGLGTIILVAGTWYGTVTAKLKKAKIKWAKKVIGLVMLIPALYYFNSLVPVTSFFAEQSATPIMWEQKAPVKSGKPEMIIFTAEWCPPCKILEAFALKSPEVVALSKSFINIKVDTTRMNKGSDAMVEKYNVVGWPSIIFVSPSGLPYDDLKIEGGLITKGELIKHMKETLRRGSGAN